MERGISEIPGDAQPHSTDPVHSSTVSRVTTRPWTIHAGWFSLIWLLFVAHSFLSTPVPGINEPHYLCKAKAFVNPDWCQRDFFLQSRNAHYCFFWLAGLLTRLMPLTAVAVVGRVLSLAVITWGWMRLGSSLSLSWRSVFLAAVCLLLIDLAGNFSGEWIVGGFESKVPAWGFGFAAVSCWLNASAVKSTMNRTLALAGFLLGLSVSLHPVVGMWFVVSIGMSEILHRTIATFRRRSSRQADQLAHCESSIFDSSFLVQSVCFLLPCLLTALPGLIPAFRILSDNQLEASEKNLANFIQVFWRLKHHLDPAEFPAGSWYYAIILLTAVCFFAFSLRRSSANTFRRSSVHRMLMLLWMATVIAGVGVAVGWHTIPAKDMQGWQWRASLLKFYPFRLFDGLVAATAALFVSLWIQEFGQSWRGAFFRSCNLHRVTRIVQFTLPVVWLFCLVTGSRPVAPAGFTPQQYSDWQDVCGWIRENTPADSLVLTPRESFAFKWFAERSEYVTYKDCPQDAGGILEWNRRLWYLNGWTLRSSSDGIYDSNDLQQLRRDTGIDFIVTRILGPFDTAPIYQGTVWQVFEVPPSGPVKQ